MTTRAIYVQGTEHDRLCRRVDCISNDSIMHHITAHTHNSYVCRLGELFVTNGQFHKDVQKFSNIYSQIIMQLYLSASQTVPSEIAVIFTKLNVWQLKCIKCLSLCHYTSTLRVLFSCDKTNFLTGFYERLKR